MTIQKGVITYTFTFMFDSNINSVDAVNAMDINDILEESRIGHMLGVGIVYDSIIAEIPNNEVAAEEVKLGGDGTFFADPDELADAAESGRFVIEFGVIPTDIPGQDGERMALMDDALRAIEDSKNAEDAEDERDAERDYRIAMQKLQEYDAIHHPK